MSQETQYFTLVKLETGEEPGTWGLVLNTNFDKIDLALQSLKSSNASIEAPAVASEGLLWYDITLDAMKIYRDGNFDFLLNHQHGVTVGVDPINLSDSNQTEGQLPAARINRLGLIAEKLDNGGAGIALSGLASYLVGNGLTVSIIGGTNKISLVEIPGLDTVNYKTKFTLDAYGRVIAASRPTSIIDLGVTDVYTKSTMDASFAQKDHIHSDLAGSAHNHDTQYAGIAGSSNNFFNTKTPAPTDTTTYAINIAYASSYLALKGGNNANVFQVANVILADGDTTNLFGAINKQTAEARYSKTTHTHAGTYEPAGTLHDTIYIRRDGTNAMNAALSLVAGNPTANLHAVHKSYLETYTSSTYALKAGSSTQAFNVKDAVNTSEAVAYGQAVSIFASKAHAHSYATISDVLVTGDQIKADILSSGSNQFSSQRQAILSCRSTGAGAPDWLIGAANLLTLHTDGALAQAFIASIANGFGDSGDINSIVYIPKDITGASNQTYDTTALVNATHYLLYAKNDYTFAYQANGSFAAAANIIRLSGVGNVTLADLPSSGKIKVTLDNAEIWVFTFGKYMDTGYEDGSYIQIFNNNTSGINQGLPSGITNLANIYIVRNESQEGVQVAPGPDPLMLTLTELDTTTLAPVYNQIAPGAPATGQIWFDIDETTAYEYNGTAWIVRPCVEIASFVKSGGSITSVNPYRVGTMVPSWNYANKSVGATTDNFASFDSLGNLKDSGKNNSSYLPSTYKAPYDINWFLIGTPAISITVFKFVAPRACTIKTAHYGNVGTNPSAQTDLDIQVNGISKSTLRIATNGAISFIDNGFNNMAIVAGDRIEVRTPVNLNGTANIAFSINAEA